MSKENNNLKKVFADLGISEQQRQIYLYLLGQGVCSALVISKGMDLGRTTVYRLLDELEKKALVNVVVDANGKKFEAQPPEQLNRLIEGREAELSELKKQSSQVVQELDAIHAHTHGKTKTLYYRGVSGLKQITWNSLKAQDGLRICEIESMDAFLPHAYAEKVRHQLVKREIFTKQLTNKTYQEPFTAHTEKV